MLVVPLEQLRNGYERLGLGIRFEGYLIASRFVGACVLYDKVETILPSGLFLAIASFGSSEGIAYPADLQAVSRRPGRIWILTSVATHSVAREHFSRLRVRRTAFSSTLPIEPSPSLRASS